MKYAILSVRDIKAASYSQPFYAPTLGHGIRSFLDACQNEDPNNMMKKHPEDFQLFHLGTFDDQQASFELQQPQLVSTAVEAHPLPN